MSHFLCFKTIWSSETLHLKATKSFFMRFMQSRLLLLMLKNNAKHLTPDKIKLQMCIYEVALKYDLSSLIILCSTVTRTH